MIYAILIGIAALLLGGFLMLAAFERNRGLRVAGAVRNKLDKRVARLAFVATHVDWGAFLRHLTGTALERVLHDIAHGILQFVRISERFLTRTVRTLRERRGIESPEEEESEGNPLSRGIERVRTALRNSRKVKK